ncbi:SAM-dependent methyltransferase [Rhodoblastus acidophilus]|uniref:class I SAM-dependent methyltransferase n=1 Tax=Rhodoblastus acidophilus TaxID=1074 RepID=UPI0022255875|nr:class I SAM-dependent methyltransferase [Rhodoblastus acidophilus]MCW2285573.1 SAM-dependent methyltransferase [Rhodoblastus acidophilus]MCW2334511.1 SAM-dependent methyltransferase [Rhodoblastus acidophilus]
MAEKPVHEAIPDEDFARRRIEARQRLDAIDPARQGRGGDPFRRDWFHAVYALAEGDAAKVPWGNLSAHPHLSDWLANTRLDGMRALDIGSGLGDNAAALAGQGAEVTGFDLVADAVDWAKQRFPHIAFQTADLFAPPPEWAEAFDFISEIYTLQALPADLLPQARQALACFLKPGGQLLVIARARDETQAIDGPPWPLTRSDLLAFEACGLAVEALEDIPPGATPNRHWRALFRRP